MSQYRIYQVDAFTSRSFAGNPAGVVPDARGLSDQAMQAIAREMNLSETAFVMPGEAAGDDVQVRFFTPTAEVPICGHATISAHYVLAAEGGPIGTRHQHTKAGVLAVDTERHDNAIRIWMHQQPGSFGTPFDSDTLDLLVAALGLERGDLLDDYPVQVVSTGHSKVVIPVRSRARIAGINPDMAALTALSARVECNGFYPWTSDDPEPCCLTHGRMFAPAIGIAEDPVTGNASGCLGAYMVEHDLLPIGEDGTASFYAGQGVEIGRPGRVLVEARREKAGDPIAIRIAGEAVIVIKGELTVE